MFPSGSGVPLAKAGGSGGRTPCTQAQQSQVFDYFVVLDFEATCEKGVRIYPQEIIEFPSVLVDSATGLLESEFRCYVRPQHHPVLTDYCLDNGVQLAEALRLHGAWLEASARARKGGRFAVVTWGDWDCRTMLESECRFKGLTKPPYFDQWINLKIPFATAFGCGRCAALQVAVQTAGLEWKGRPHCGLDDARNTARLLVELMRRGVQLGITGSLAPPPPPPQPPPPPPPQPPRLLPQPQVTAGCCYCGVASRSDVVAVPGPMQGRCFYSCGNWTPDMRATCSYFMWADC